MSGRRLPSLSPRFENPNDGWPFGYYVLSSYHTQMEAFPSMKAAHAYGGESAGIDGKVVIMGSSGVGKTSLLHRYAHDKFDPTAPTTGALLLTKKVNINGLRIRLQLWDTAGQERFRSMAPMYYRGANAALLLYDTTNLSTFKDVRSWLEELKRNCDSNLIIYIVGSKMDLTSRRQVTSDYARMSLHEWFPPIEPPRQSPTPPPTSTTMSFIRPRFTSFTSTKSVPHLSQPPKKASPSTTDSTESSIRQPRLQRSNTSSAIVPRSRARTTSAGGLARAASARPFAKIRHSPLHRGGDLIDNTDSNTLINEDEEENEKYRRRKISEDHEVPDEILDTREWGLQSGMELFEVSAKDARGVNQLFDHLILAIIAKKEIIERDNQMRRRDSVFLSSTHEPSWAAQAEEEEARELSQMKNNSFFGSWSCCAS